MNLVEGLSREISRVSQMASDAKDMADTPGVNMSFYIATCAQSIEEGHCAMGTGDIPQMKAAYEALAEIN